MSTSSGRGLHGSISLPILGTIRLFTFCLSCECIIVSCFNLQFFDDSWSWAFFPTLIHYLYFYVHDIPIHIFFFFLPSFQSFVILYLIRNYIFWMLFNTSLVLLVAITLCWFVGLSFNSLYGVFRWTKILNFNVAKFINLCLYGLYLLCLAGEILPSSEVLKIFSYIIFQ